MRFFICTFLFSFLFACNNTEQARINSVEECFNVKIPECAELVRNDYWGELADYTFELEFEFDEDCFTNFLEKLPNAKQFVEIEDEDHSFYRWEKDDKIENATLDVFHKKRRVIFHFVHI